MPQWIIDEWRELGLGVLIIGGRALVERGVRESTGDLDCCVPARQCPRMLEWLLLKERAGRVVRLVPGCAPLNADWLANGWFCHVFVDRDELDFFGVPMRAPPSYSQRFRADPVDIAFASLEDMGYLKRTGREKDWEDVDRIADRLRDDGDLAGALRHLVGERLVDQWEASREQASWREAIERGDLVRLRPILRLGLAVSTEEFRAMARAERAFWVTAGGLRREEIKGKGREFWERHGTEIGGSGDFEDAHGRLQAAAVGDLPQNPIGDPTAIIDAARKASGVDQWKGLLPPTAELVPIYFPAWR